MTYSTVEGVFRKLQQDLYDETEIESRIEDTDVDVRSWINASVNRTTDFTEDELTGDDSIIRLAADCYAACRIMSEQLEGHNIDTESLAVFRCSEAREHIIMWCNNNGIIPSFIPPSEESADAASEVHTEYGYAIGTDAVCIG